MEILTSAILSYHIFIVSSKIHGRIKLSKRQICRFKMLQFCAYRFMLRTYTHNVIRSWCRMLNTATRATGYPYTWRAF